MKYNISDKVVPVRKTVKRWEGLENSNEWTKVKNSKRKFLYVNRVNVKDFDGQPVQYVCGKYKIHKSGDFFNESDLIPYVEK